MSLWKIDRVVNGYILVDSSADTFWADWKNLGWIKRRLRYGNKYRFFMYKNYRYIDLYDYDVRLGSKVDNLTDDDILLLIKGYKLGFLKKAAEVVREKVEEREDAYIRGWSEQSGEG